MNPGPGPDAHSDLGSPSRATIFPARSRLLRVLASLVLGCVLVVLVYRTLPGFNLPGAIVAVRDGDLLLVLASVGVYYLGFYLRGWRWSVLLETQGLVVRPLKCASTVVLASGFNALVFGGLGDLLRAYLIKSSASRSGSFTAAIGTIVVERVLDPFAILAVLLCCLLVSQQPLGAPIVVGVLGLGLIAALVGVAFIVALRTIPPRTVARLTRLPMSEVVHESLWKAVSSCWQGMPTARFFALSAGVWLTEALRTYFVVQALSLPGAHLSLGQAATVALASSLLSTIQLTPAGLGVIEAGAIGILTIGFSVPAAAAGSVVLLDRSVAVASVVFVAGGILVKAQAAKLINAPAGFGRGALKRDRSRRGDDQGD